MPRLLPTVHGASVQRSARHGAACSDHRIIAHRGSVVHQLLPPADRRVEVPPRCRSPVILQVLPATDVHAAG